MSSKISKLVSRLFIVLMICPASWLAASEAPSESIEIPGAPLGTVWVKELDTALKQYHLPMAQSELTYSRHAGIQTNIAMFGLNLRQKDGTVVPILDRSSKVFLSGGVMLIRADTEELEDIGRAKEILRQKITTKEGQLLRKITDTGVLPQQHRNQLDVCLKTFDEIQTAIQRLRDEIEQLKKEADSLREKEKNYAPQIFTTDPRYADHTNAIYDSEQTITRIVDYHINQSGINDESLTINSHTFRKNEIDGIIFNLHTRTDMCPFCSMFLAQKLRGWQQKMAGIPVVALVTSRQEYRCAYPFIVDKPYYQGFSMRSFARRREDDGSSFEGLKSIAKAGIVVQYAFQPEEVYTSLV